MNDVLAAQASHNRTGSTNEVSLDNGSSVAINMAGVWLSALDSHLVRSVELEPTAFCSGDKGLWTQGFLFNNAVSADMPYFGPFAANWVGIWVGDFSTSRASPSWEAVNKGGSHVKDGLLPALEPVSKPATPRRCDVLLGKFTVF